MLLFDLSRCCNSICSLCHQFSYRHRLPCPYTRSVCPCLVAHVHLAGGWKRSHHESIVHWCLELGQSCLCFGLQIVTATVWIATMMPAGGLELKLLSAYQMGLVSLSHGDGDRWLGMGPQIFGCHLELQGALLWCFVALAGLRWQGRLM